MAGAPLDTSSPRAPARINVGQTERVASGLVGGVLVLAGIRRRSLGGAALALLGGDLVRRGVTGHCEVYQALDVSTADGAESPAGAPQASAVVERSITINGSPADLYRYWRDPHYLAHVLGDAVTVRQDGPALEHWVVRAPLGREVTFDAEYLEDRPGEVIRWRTRPGADVPHDGTLRFRPAPGDWGTEVHLRVSYDPPGGILGDAAAKLFNGVPDTLAGRTLRRFKSLVETGELPTLAHNPSGRRDTAGGRAGGVSAAGYDAGGTHVPLSDHTT